MLAAVTLGGGTVKSLELAELMEHMEWADAVLWAALLAHAGAAEDRRTRELMYHVHTVQSVYLQLCRGDAMQVRAADEFADLPAIYRYGRDTHAAFARWLASNPDAGRAIHFPWASQLVEWFGEARAASVSQGILQVTSHSTYHRGQVNTRLRELGGEPPLVDFIAWIWAGKPAAQWPEA